MPASYIPVSNYNIIINHKQLHRTPNRAIQNMKVFRLEKTEYSEKSKAHEGSQEKASR